MDAGWGSAITALAPIAGYILKPKAGGFVNAGHGHASPGRV